MDNFAGAKFYIKPSSLVPYVERIFNKKIHPQDLIGMPRDVEGYPPDLKVFYLVRDVTDKGFNYLTDLHNEGRIQLRPIQRNVL